MKKKIISMLLLCVLLSCGTFGFALAGFGTAIVDGGNSDRVNLREYASLNSDSLGLYFTGTEVTCISDPNKEWVRVTVGSQTGYMKSDFLYQGTGSVTPEQPSGQVTNIKAGSWVNLRSKPSLSAAVAGKLYKGDVVTVLGETHDQWYYVKAGSHYGYILASYLLVSSSDTSQNDYGTAIVNGGNADRVNLRKSASLSSDSLGLYFTGTEVVCNSDPSKEWVSVTIGSQSGYIKSQYLYRGAHPGIIGSAQPIVTVKSISALSWINMRSQPSLQAAVAGKIHKGDTVTVLGETHDYWYYVNADGLYGYVMAGYLSSDIIASQN